ncbi:hypothetical protein [Paramuribaculum intestinale]|uniref:hypothetical protein n=1 Tax=Paramuribaculum intestinale TaxID=2094151 RepID=UPI0025B49DF4|nr:hypothetical protein [Paramuribaculum intestinale]
MGGIFVDEQLQRWVARAGAQRLISHAPQLGRVVWTALPPPVRSDRGFHLPARSAAPRAPPHPAGRRESAWARMGVVVDHTTSVNPAMARIALPWWGEAEGWTASSEMSR